MSDYIYNGYYVISILDDHDQEIDMKGPFDTLKQAEKNSLELVAKGLKFQIYKLKGEEPVINER